MTNHIEGTMHLIVRKHIPSDYRVPEIRPVRVTKSEPTGTLEPGEVVVKFRVRIPLSAFDPLVASDLVVVSEEDVVRHAEVESAPHDA